MYLDQSIGSDKIYREPQYKKILKNFVEFCGTVPTAPNRLKGIDKKENDSSISNEILLNLVDYTKLKG